MAMLGMAIPPVQFRCKGLQPLRVYIKYMSRTGKEKIDRHILRKYEIGMKIGEGAYGIVWRAIDKSNHKVIALKKIFDGFQNVTDAQRTYREIMLLFKMRHENIIKLKECIHARNDQDIYTVFEIMDTDLHAVIRENILEDIHKKYVIYQLLKVLKYLHSANLLHRDIKPSNILLNTECFLKLCDFGLARVVDSRHQEPIMTDYVATRWYRAPEILLGSTKYSKAVDIWAVGCILAELLSQKPIFPGGSTMDQLRRIIDVTGKPGKNDIRSINSVYAESMIRSIPNLKNVNPILNTELNKKKLQKMFPTADPDALDLLSQFFQFNPSKRITAENALKHPYVALFHNPEDEPNCSQKIKLLLSDSKKYEIAEYREKIYREIRKRRRVRKRRRKMASGDNNDKESTSKRGSGSGSGGGEKRKKKNNGSGDHRSRNNHNRRNHRQRRRKRGSGRSSNPDL